MHRISIDDLCKDVNIMRKLLSRVFCAFAALCTIFCTCPDAKADNLPSVSAKGAVVINASTGEVLYSHFAEKSLPMASTTKIMTTILAIEHGDLDSRFTVDPVAVRVEGSSMGLKENDKVTLRDLCYGMMLPSGNDAANCTAVRVGGSIENFVQLMNDKAKQLGLENTHFVTPSGLDDYTQDHYSSALDMARLTRYAMKNKEFRKICSAKSVKLSFGDPPYDRWLTNTNKLLKTCHGVIGVKTGFTDKAGRCLVSCCSRGGTELICVTLGDRNDWQDHSRLYDSCFPLVARQELSCGTKGFVLNVAGGECDKIRCRIQPAYACISKDSRDSVRSVVHLPMFVYAPVKKGDAVGRVDFWYKGELIAQSAIYADEDCPLAKGQDKGFVDKLKQKLILWLS